MSFIVGYTMLVFENEDECFYFLLSLLSRLGNYHTPSMRDVRIDLKAMDDLLEQHANKLFTHLHSFRYTADFICMEWFLTLFSRSFPPEFAFRVWDTFIEEGDKILFRTALGVGKMMEDLVVSK